VLDGFRLRSDAKVVRFPDRYQDPRGQHMWNTVWDVLGDHDPERSPAPSSREGFRDVLSMWDSPFGCRSP
jgi:hypothetical protein